MYIYPAPDIEVAAASELAAVGRQRALSLSRQFREQIKSVCIHHHNSLMVDPASHNPFG
jgi:hypothetical protein